MKNTSEPFFVDDNFYTDLEDYMEQNDLAEVVDVNQFDDDWTQEIHLCREETIFEIDKGDFEGVVDDLVDGHEDRIGERDVSEDILAAIMGGLDLAKVNAAMPKLWYPNGEKDTITKQDLLDNASATSY